MGYREELLSEIAVRQLKLDVLDRAPEDTFTFGTVVVFDAGNGRRTYYAKVNEEAWIKLNGSPTEKPLNIWILLYVENFNGYFEIYELKPQAVPIFASS